jgi:hypothetical protein
MAESPNWAIQFLLLLTSFAVPRHLHETQRSRYTITLDSTEGSQVKQQFAWIINYNTLVASMSTPILALENTNGQFPRALIVFADTSYNLTFHDCDGLLLKHPSCCILSMQKGEEVGGDRLEAMRELAILFEL